MLGPNHFGPLSLYLTSCKVGSYRSGSSGVVLIPSPGFWRTCLGISRIYGLDSAPSDSYLRPQVKVAVDGQHGVAVILQGQREEAVAVVLQELLQQELRRGCEERVLAVGGADVLGWHDGHGAVRHLRGEGRVSATPSHPKQGPRVGGPIVEGCAVEQRCENT